MSCGGYDSKVTCTDFNPRGDRMASSGKRQELQAACLWCRLDLSRRGVEGKESSGGQQAAGLCLSALWHGFAMCGHHSTVLAAVFTKAQRACSLPHHPPNQWSAHLQAATSARSGTSAALPLARCLC